LGEVLITDDDIFGDGVNIAARLQALCEPDGVCLSNAVHGQVKGAIDETFVGAQMGAPVNFWHMRPIS
jgi:class 3 adenylate cyclase